MKLRIAMTMAVTLVGCGTPYQANGLRGGYEDYRAGAGGAVMVTFNGNGHTSQGAVTRMWHRRAAEVCGGPDKYVVLESEASSDVTEGASTTTTNMTFSGNHATATSSTSPGMTWTKHGLQGQVRCVNGGSYNTNRKLAGSDD
jgi:hypothetical protein